MSQLKWLVPELGDTTSRLSLVFELKELNMLKTLTIAALTLAIAIPAAMAGSPVTHGQAKNIQAALNGQDCYGGEMEAESKGKVAFEVDDAVCRDGEYDFKLDKDFNILSRSKQSG